MKKLPHCKDSGLLILRVGLGLTFIFLHGGPKLLGGPERWEQIGGAMSNLGISFAPTFWGFMAAVSEAVGGALLIAGLLTQPAALFLLFTMFVAALLHMNLPESNPNSGLKGASHAIEVGIAFLALFVAGPGRYSLDRLLGLTGKGPKPPAKSHEDRGAQFPLKEETEVESYDKEVEITHRGGD